MESRLRLTSRLVCLAALCAAAGACGAAAAASAVDRISSRRGELSATRSDQETFVISLNARPVAHVSASEVSFYRVTPRSGTDYIVVELWKPGLNCQRSYVVLALPAAGNVQRSGVFGDCTELRAARDVRGGMQVELRPVVQQDPSRTVLEHYLFSNGKLSRQRTSVTTASH